MFIIILFLVYVGVLFFGIARIFAGNPVRDKLETSETLVQLNFRYYFIPQKHKTQKIFETYCLMAIEMVEREATKEAHRNGVYQGEQRVFEIAKDKLTMTLNIIGDQKQQEHFEAMARQRLRLVQNAVAAL